MHAWRGKDRRAILALPALAGAVLLLAGCAGDPHPASPDTPGDPWHPYSSEVPASPQDGSDNAPPRLSGDLETSYTTTVR